MFEEAETNAQIDKENFSKEVEKLQRNKFTQGKESQTLSKC